MGTIAAIRAAGRDMAPCAIDLAFDAVCEVETLMSVFAPGSDLSFLHRQPAGRPVRLNPLTIAAIELALDVARHSCGLFDPALGGETAMRGAMPVPAESRYGLTDVLGASWRDVSADDGCVVLARPLWLDLNGIAKGLAVDRAVECLRSQGAVQGCVNIGGDLRVFGPDTEQVALRTAVSATAPVIDVREAAVASSGAAPGRVTTRHVDPGAGGLVDERRFASVIAPSCALADALTKAALCGGGQTLAQRYDARFITFVPGAGWQTSVPL